MGATSPVIDVLAWIGVLTFAAMGALAATQKGLDLLGVVVLAAVTAVGGGSIRDIVVGNLPPAVFRDEPKLWAVVAVALLVFRFSRTLDRLGTPMWLLDTLALGVFAALGAETGLVAGLGFFGTVFAGTVSAIGGGMVRDLFLGIVPAVLTNNRDLYASSAAAGAAVVFVVPHLAPGLLPFALLCGAGTTIALRAASRYLGLHLPRAGAT